MDTNTTPTHLTRDEIVATDTRLAEIYAERHDAEYQIKYAVKILNDLANPPRGLDGHRPDGYTLAELRRMYADGQIPERSFTYGKNTIDLFATIDEQRAIIRNLDAEQAPLDAAFYAQRWSRFFLVTNEDGHIHSSMHCSTCRWTTEFAWLPTLSDQTEAEAVAAHGGILCTVCFPSAPTEWTNGESHEKAAKKAEAAARKAEREAKKLEKALQPDGATMMLYGKEVLNGRGQYVTRRYGITTLAQARTWLREISDVRAEGRDIATSYTGEWNCWTVDNEAIVTFAIAAKTGTTATAVRDEFTAKAEKKAKRYA